MVYENYNNADAGNAGWVVIPFVFAAVCGFDLADEMFDGKVFGLAALWGVTLLDTLVVANICRGRVREAPPGYGLT